MTPPSLCTRSLHARFRAVFAGLMVAATFGVGASPDLLAQQPTRGATPRRPEAVAKPSVPDKRGAASTAVAKPGEHRGEKRPTSAAAKPTRSRAPAADRAAAGVQQTSAVVAADGGVILAGGAVATADCRQCGRQGCAKCRPAGGRLGLPCNGLCDQGGCQAHCPVRPDQFGYYATRWRSWPGQGVKQVGHFDPATTPVVPPRSEVPGMEEELALPSQRDEIPAEEDEDEAEDEEAMAEGDGAAPSGGEAKPSAEADGKVSKAEKGLPPAKPNDAGDGDDSDTKAEEAAKPSPTPLDGLLDTSGADAKNPSPPVTDGAWSTWSRSTTVERQPMAAGSVVRTSGPADPAAEADSAVDRRDVAKLRSPAQRMVEGSGRAAGRWRAKATASAEAAGETAANPLRGVTAQPGNPLR